MRHLYLERKGSDWGKSKFREQRELWGRAQEALPRGMVDTGEEPPSCWQAGLPPGTVSSPLGPGRGGGGAVKCKHFASLECSATVGAIVIKTAFSTLARVNALLPDT